MPLVSRAFLATEVAYPYTGTDTTGCRAGRVGTAGAVTLARPSYQVVPGTAEAIMAAVYRRGVAVVYWNVDESFVGYTSGGVWGGWVRLCGLWGGVWVWVCLHGRGGGGGMAVALQGQYDGTRRRPRLLLPPRPAPSPFVLLAPRRQGSRPCTSPSPLCFCRQASTPPAPARPTASTTQWWGGGGRPMCVGMPFQS